MLYANKGVCVWLHVFTPRALLHYNIVPLVVVIRVWGAGYRSIPVGSSVTMGVYLPLVFSHVRRDVYKELLRHLDFHPEESYPYIYYIGKISLLAFLQMYVRAWYTSDIILAAWNLPFYEFVSWWPCNTRDCQPMGRSSSHVVPS